MCDSVMFYTAYIHSLTINDVILPVVIPARGPRTSGSGL